MKTKNTDELIVIMHKNKTFAVDGSYFPVIPDLIAVPWILIDETESPVGAWNVISTVAPEHGNTFAAESCGALSMMEMIDHAMLKMHLPLWIFLLKQELIDDQQLIQFLIQMI